ncbi:MAG: LuxR C-terminal-related transcriptional regulator [Acidimicrobiales bacterium]
MMLAGSGDLIGRGDELADVDRILGDAARSGIALAGPAGVGKSRLAAEVGERAERLGWAVVSAAATPVSATITLGALSHLLPPAGDLASVHADLQPAQLLQAATATLAALAGAADGRRLCLLIDDAHHLDAVSAHLVHQLASTRVAFVVVTVRTGEATPDPIVALWKDAHLARIDLGPLTFADTTALAAHLLDAPLDGDTATWLWRTSGGNALFARELLAGAAEQGALQQVDGRWRLRDGAGRMSPRLADLVDQRLSGLSADLRRALDLVALAEPIGLDLAEEVVGTSALMELDARGLLHMATSGHRAELRPVHPLFGEALRQQPMSLRRRADLLELVRLVESRGARRRDDPVRITGWQLAAGSRADPAVLLRAAIAALHGFDDRAAARLATVAIEQRAPIGDLRDEILLTRATAQARLGRFAEADVDLAELADRGTDDQRARIALRRVMTLAEGSDDVTAGAAAGAAALDRLAHSDWSDDVRCVVATMLGDFGRITAAADTIAPIVERPATAHGASAWMLARTAILQGRGDWDACAVAAVDGYEFQLAHPDEDATFHPLSQYVYRLTALTRAGRFDEAETGLREIVAMFVEQPRPVGGVVSRLMLARLLLARGAFDDAAALVDAAVALLGPSLQPYLHRWAGGMRIWLHACTGELRIDDLPRELSALSVGQRAGVGFGGADVTCGRLAGLIGLGRTADARRLLAEALDQAAADGDRGSEFDLALFGCLELGDPAAATRLHAWCDTHTAETGAMVAIARSIAVATSGRDPAVWLAASAAAGEAGAWFIAARAATHAAAAARDAGATRVATSATRQAGDALARTQRGRIAELATTGGGGPQLTARELDVVRLVAAGRSSKEVAATLSLSSRTVDNHLQRIYTKLGVSTRAELAAWLAGR